MCYENSYILAVETSSRIGSVALGKGERVLGFEQFASMARHGVELIPTADKLLKEHNVCPCEIDVICVSGGPGSFTGLRVGFSFARALAQVADAKLVKVSSTEVIAEKLKKVLSDRRAVCSVAIVVDAKRNQIFAAGFEWNGDVLVRKIDDCVVFPNELIDRLPMPIIVAGEGLMFHREKFERTGIEIADESYWRGDAKYVYELGWQAICNGEFVERDKFVPNYIRLPEAEEKWRERNEKK